MAKHLEGIEFVRAANCARSLSESAIVAYYMAGPGPEHVKIHYMHMRLELDKLCEVMGLRVVDAEEVSA